MTNDYGFNENHAFCFLFSTKINDVCIAKSNASHKKTIK